MKRINYDELAECYKLCEVTDEYNLTFVDIEPESSEDISDALYLTADKLAIYKRGRKQFRKKLSSCPDNPKQINKAWITCLPNDEYDIGVN